MAKVWTKKEENELVENYPTMPRRELCDLLKRQWGSITSKANALGLLRQEIKPHKKIEAIKPGDIPVKIDNKTTIYVRPGQNIEACKQRYTQHLATLKTGANFKRYN